MTGEFDENCPNAFIYTLIRDKTLCIEISDSEDDHSSEQSHIHVPKHDETLTNEINPNPNPTECKRQVLITVSTRPMVINPFAVLKEREMRKHGQAECGETTCSEVPSANDDQSNASK